jgi:Skp family chaperone for outer membrane proteins
VTIFSRIATFFCLTAGLLAGASPSAVAQSSPGYFIPPSAQSAPPEHASQPPAPAAVATAGPGGAQAAPGGQGVAGPQQQLPPVPQLPALPPGNPPPVAVIGVLSVPDVMQKSTAAEGVQAIIHGRQAALEADAEKARAKIQAAQQAITAQRTKLTDAQLEAKEQALQNEIAETQTEFQARNQAIQNSGQAALGQIEAMLIAIIRQEAQARGMNLILHREQVALNINAFDITADVTAELNKLLPSVTVPPSVVTQGMLVNAQEQGAEQGTAQEQGDGQ